MEAEGFMDGGYTELILQERPTLSKEHVFTLSITKSNGETLSASTEKINWE